MQAVEPEGNVVRNRGPGYLLHVAGVEHQHRLIEGATAQIGDGGDLDHVVAHEAAHGVVTDELAQVLQEGLDEGPHLLVEVSLQVTHRVAGLDGRIASGAQLALFRELAAALRGQTFWLTRRAARSGATVKALTGRYAGPVQSLRALMPEVLSPHERSGMLSAADRLISAGAPPDIARTVALTRALTTAADLVDLAAASRWSLAGAARAYHAVGAVFGFDRVRTAAGDHSAGDPFERTAVRRLIEDLLAAQAAVAGEVMRFAGKPSVGESIEQVQTAVEAWRAGRGPVADATQRTLAEIEAAGGDWTFAKLTIAQAALRELTAPSAGGAPRRR